MNIALFSDIFYPELSGISDSVFLLAKALARRGHHVEIFAPYYTKKNHQKVGLPDKELDLGPNIRIWRLPSLHFPAPTEQGRMVLPHLLRTAFAKTHFDIIHTHTFFGAGLEALLLAKRKHIQFVGTNHTLIEAFSPIGAAWAKTMLSAYLIWYYNHCDYITTPSAFLSLHMKAQGLRVPVRVLSNPIEEEFFVARSGKSVLKKELGFAQCTFLYAGRLSSEKNVEILLDAFIEFAPHAPDADLVLVGGGVLRTALIDRAQKSSVASQIKILGPFLGAHKARLHDIFHAADIFVMPSTSETQSMVTLQAMAGGMQIIAANHGPLPGLVGDTKGILFEPGNKKDLVRVMAQCYNETKGVWEENAHARMFAEEFSETAIADEWEKIYTDVIIDYDKKHPTAKHQSGYTGV